MTKLKMLKALNEIEIDALKSLNSKRNEAIRNGDSAMTESVSNEYYKRLAKSRDIRVKMQIEMNKNSTRPKPSKVTKYSLELADRVKIKEANVTSLSYERSRKRLDKLTDQRALGKL